MCSSRMKACLWNTGQNRLRTDVAFFILALLLYQVGWSTQSDFLDTMSKQFFGLLTDNNKGGHERNQHNSQEGFAHMFGLNGQQTQHHPQTRPPANRYSPRPNQQPAGHIYRQGYYPPPPAGHHYHPSNAHYAHGQPVIQSPPEGQAYYAYGHQQGFGQTGTKTNETSTAQPRSPEPYNLQQTHYAPHPNQQAHYEAAPHVVTEYHPYPPPEAEYPPSGAEYHEPVVQIHHAPPPAEYHYPEEHHYHHTTHKPKRFHLSYNEPSPDLKIIDKHLRLPPVKFRFHINPKITITTDTKDPLEKKEKHNDHHDIEPYPPPDVYSDPEAPPSINSHKTEHYPVEHAYPIGHYPVEHYPVEHYPVAHHPVAHHPVVHHEHQYGEPVYDLRHLNPHRSSGHYEPTFKIKTRPIIFTDPPPTRRTTTTTTARPTTSTTTTTTTTTTRRPSRTRSRAQARNPGFSVSFTQSGSTSTAMSIQRSVTVSPSTSSTTTSRTSLFGSSGRERETDSTSVIERKDSGVEVVSTETTSTSITTQSTSTASTTTTTTTPSTTTTTTTPSTTTTTTTTPSTTTTTTTPSTTTTTTTSAPTTTTTAPTTRKPQTTSASTTSTSTAAPTITTASVTPASAATLVSFVTRTSVVTRTSSSPAEMTTARSSTLNSNANEIDMKKPPTNTRRRLEPLTAEEAALEGSESVKVIETTMLIDGKNQTVRFYYITQPVKLPLDVFNRMTGQKAGSSNFNLVRLRNKRFTERKNSNPTSLFPPP